MKNRKIKSITETFDIVLEGSPVTVKATSYETPSTEARYRVSINGSSIYIFGWDPHKNRLAAIERSGAATAIPPQIEQAVAMQIQNKMAA